MYRIRLHGRGGQGMKTAGRILGRALFLAGFDVQDAPRYGAERRGAPVFSFVRAAQVPPLERGIISRPDLVVVADDTLISIPGGGVLQGVHPRTVLLMNSLERAELWQDRLGIDGCLYALDLLGKHAAMFIGVACVGAAAALIREITPDLIREAVAVELAGLEEKQRAENSEVCLDAYCRLSDRKGAVQESGPVPVQQYQRPAWVTLRNEGVEQAAPVIHAGLTSLAQQTGLWRTRRPVINYEHCKKCWWICSTFCPEGIISVDGNRFPVIDYDHCKGCMVCLAQCPVHAISARPEAAGRQMQRAGA